MKYGDISLVLCISTRLRLVTILSQLVKYLVILHADPCNKSYNYHAKSRLNTLVWSSLLSPNYHAKSRLNTPGARFAHTIIENERAYRAKRTHCCTLIEILLYYIYTRKWFPLQGERAHSLNFVVCMYDNRINLPKSI